jgi:EAL domain-containing protein (putative c-di-GMP-specific phosphodiesterase class I)/GGDEF domain-containing protein
MEFPKRTSRASQAFPTPDRESARRSGADPHPGMAFEPEAGDQVRAQLLAYGQRYDLHTGLLTYEHFQDSLIAQLRRAPTGREFALVWIDVLNLRRAFALRGWAGAESLVRHVATVLRSIVDESALIGRFSGRCFVVAMPAAKFDRHDWSRIQALVAALRMAQPPAIQIEPEIAAGVAFYPADTASTEDLVRFASLAATRASSVNSPQAMAFHAGMHRVEVRHHQLEVEMRRGLALGQFTMAYQPKISLADGSVLGVEALIRWNHPEWSPVGPGEFIPVAERSGLIHRIFELTLRSALRDARSWSDRGFPVPIISVNASAANLRREDFAFTVRRMLREIPIAPSQLELEVTESVLFDDEELFALRVEQLKKIGVRIAIDDFGTRYTGFNVLKQVPLDAMKIDQCFIRGIHRSPDLRSVCQTIVAMARQLRMRAVAEGIEEPGELETLREIGCEAGQGYLFQRPVEEAQFFRFLRDWPRRMTGIGFPDPSLPLMTDCSCGVE